MSSKPTGIETRQMKGAVRNLLFGDDAEPIRIGRFKVLSKIGSGGMGVVYSAYDEELDRKVAIKLLLADLQGGSEGRARLKREAQAMAKLAHPNVVTVHEVGEHDGQVFVAMEFVKGQTLRTWMDEDHSWRETLDVFVQAGRGLAAAHQAGIVHRDFKPENVLLGEDGRARVLDFGLARPVIDPEATQSTSSVHPEPVEGQPLDTPLTRTGAVMGTPAYMSPEQHEGRTPDARSDQFSFSVALWEALCGQRPFAGDTGKAIATAVVGGQRRRDGGRPIQPWIRRALDLGLEIDPDARHASMDDLLSALAKDPAMRRRRRIITAGVIAAVGGAGAFGYLQARPAFQPICAPAEARFDGLWDAETKQRIGARFVDESQPHVAHSWRAMQAELDAWTQRWTGLYQATCTELATAGKRISSVSAQRLDCLEAGHRWLIEQVETLESYDALLLANQYMGRLGAGSGDLGLCENEGSLASRPPEPKDADTLTEVRAIRRKMTAARIRADNGELLAATENLASIAARIDDFPHPPTRAALLVTLGKLESRLELDDAKATLERGLLAAEASRHDFAAADALWALFWIETGRYSDGLEPTALSTEARSLRDRFVATVERAGSPATLQLQLLDLRAEEASSAGKPREAYDIEQNKVELANRTYGPDSAAAAWHTLNVARSAQFYLKDLELAVKTARRALAKLEAIFGPEHPQLADVLDNIGAMLGFLERYEEALAEYDRVFSIMERVYPDGHPRLGWAYFKAGHLLADSGRELEGIERIEQSEAMLSQHLGPNHTQVLRGPTAWLSGHRLVIGDDEGALESAERVLAKDILDRREKIHQHHVRAIALARRGDTKGALADLAAALEIIKGTGPVPGRLVFNVPMWEARVRRALGQTKQAHELAESALRLLDEIDEGGVPEGARQFGHTVVGVLRAEVGNYRQARELLEANMATIDNCCDSLWFASDARFALARALVETNGDRDRAAALARRARDGYRALGPGKADDVLEVEAWLKKHGGPK